MTGSIVDSELTMAKAIRRICAISRTTSRRVALERLDARVMAARYMELYEELAAF